MAMSSEMFWSKIVPREISRLFQSEEDDANLEFPELENDLTYDEAEALAIIQLSEDKRFGDPEDPEDPDSLVVSRYVTDEQVEKCFEVVKARELKLRPKMMKLRFERAYLIKAGDDLQRECWEAWTSPRPLRRFLETNGITKHRCKSSATAYAGDNDLGELPPRPKLIGGWAGCKIQESLALRVVDMRKKGLSYGFISKIISKEFKREYSKSSVVKICKAVSHVHYTNLTEPIQAQSIRCNTLREAEAIAYG